MKPLPPFVEASGDDSRACGPSHSEADLILITHLLLLLLHLAPSPSQIGYGQSAELSYIATRASDPPTGIDIARLLAVLPLSFQDENVHVE